jgi:hypothetical protein
VVHGEDGDEGEAGRERVGLGKGCKRDEEAVLERAERGRHHPGEAAFDQSGAAEDARSERAVVAVDLERRHRLTAWAMRFGTSKEISVRTENA